LIFVLFDGVGLMEYGWSSQAGYLGYAAILMVYVLFLVAFLMSILLPFFLFKKNKGYTLISIIFFLLALVLIGSVFSSAGGSALLQGTNLGILGLILLVSAVVTVCICALDTNFIMKVRSR
jgi:hypothetical protein